jgi:hypothetical protein
MTCVVHLRRKHALALPRVSFLQARKRIFISCQLSDLRNTRSRFCCADATVNQNQTRQIISKPVTLTLAGFPQRPSGFDPRSGSVGFVVDKLALGKVLSVYFGFPCQLSLHQMLYSHLRGALISLWLYKENKLRDWKNIFTLHIPPWAPHTYGFVVLTSLTHQRKILLVVLQIGK